jgi:two-component system, NarL family, sensor histidine kinase UhpB
MSAASPEHPIHILHLEDSDIDHALVKLALEKSGTVFDIVRVEDMNDFLRESQVAGCDVILADYRLAGFTAIDAWDALVTQARQPPFILLTGAIGEAAAVDAMRRGISDYLLKDNIGKLAHVIARTIEMRQARDAKAQADAELVLSQRRLAELTEHLQATIEQERTAIAREVHDDIGGALAAMRFDIAWIARHSSDPETLNHTATAAEMLQQAIDASQRIMMNLRPPILDQGLVAAVQWLADSFVKRTGVSTLVRMPEHPADLPKPVQLAAYRTAQEALTNITKHAQCSQVSIDLSDDEGFLTLEITDNGKGLNGTSLEKPRAFGLMGLRERARTVGGWLDVSSQPGRGTSIILSVPLQGANAEKARP